MPDFGRMTLERHGHEGSAVDLADQNVQASSSRDEPVTYTFAEHGRSAGDAYSDDWIEAVDM